MTDITERLACKNKYAQLKGLSCVMASSGSTSFSALLLISDSTSPQLQLPMPKAQEPFPLPRLMWITITNENSDYNDTTDGWPLGALTMTRSWPYKSGLLLKMVTIIGGYDHNDRRLIMALITIALKTDHFAVTQYPCIISNWI